MPTGFHDASLFQNMYDISVHRGGKAMSDDDGRAPGSKATEPLEPISFGPRIERAGWLVQYDNRRASQEGPSQRYALPLPGAQLHTAHKPLPQKALVSSRQPRDNLFRPGRADGRFDLAALGQ